MGVRRELAIEALDVEPEKRGILAEVPVAQCALMFEDVIVHLPESMLRAGRFRGFGSVLRVWMKFP